MIGLSCQRSVKIFFVVRVTAFGPRMIGPDPLALLPAAIATTERLWPMTIRKTFPPPLGRARSEKPFFVRWRTRTSPAMMIADARQPGQRARPRSGPVRFLERVPETYLSLTREPVAAGQVRQHLEGAG